jgi:hypothetical protein
MMLRFIGIDAIEVWVHRGSVTVAAMADGDCVDLLACWEAFPEQIPTGVVCTMCEPAAKVLCATPEDLLRDHLFELLRCWILEELALGSGPINHLERRGGA